MELTRLVFEILTSVGTIGATILALWLAASDKVRRVDAVFVWGVPTSYQPHLFVKNMGNRAVVIDRIHVAYNFKDVCEIDLFDSYELRKFAILKANDEVTIPLDPKSLSIKAPKNHKKNYRFEITIVPRQGRKFISKQKYSYNDLQELLFGCALFSD